MPTLGPYQLLHTLGTCQVGDVWSATDTNGNPVTMAVLKPEAASDLALRDAFAAAANGLAQSGQVPVISGDFHAATPWIASLAGDGSVVAQVFVALGLAYQPVAPPAAEPPTQPIVGSDADTTQPVNLPPSPTSPPPTEVSAPPPPGQIPPVSIPPAGVPPPPPPPPSPPASGPPAPVSVPPSPMTVPPEPMPGGHSSAPQPAPMPGWAPPFSDTPPHGYPSFGPPPNGSRRRRTALLVGILLLGILALGGGGGAIAFAMRPNNGGTTEPTAAPTDDPTSAPVTPQAAPSQPGVEPPLEESWPDEWPAFEADEAFTHITGLTGVHFEFAVPEGWACVEVTVADAAVHYTCGPGGDASELGGDLIVRECPDPCDSDQRVVMRQAEEAWGLQWVRDTGHRSWAESEQINGEERYRFVLVGYTRTTDESRLDRQVVLRMSAPVDDQDVIRKIAGSIRLAIL